MTTSPQFHVYHCADAPLPWCAVIWVIGDGPGGRKGPRIGKWEPLPMMFHGKTEITAGDAAESWWREQREKEAEAAKAATDRATARKAKREEALE